MTAKMKPSARKRPSLQFASLMLILTIMMSAILAGCGPSALSFNRKILHNLER
jgi:hypothetical protein